MKFTYDDGLEALPGLGAFDAPIIINGEQGITRQELIADPQQPATEMEAMMAAIPHEEVVSVLVQKQYAESVSDCLDFLDPEVVETLDALGGEDLSLSELAARMRVGKTTAYRRKEDALEQLRQVASCNPAAQMRLNLDDGGFEAAARRSTWRVLTGEGYVRPKDGFVVDGDGADWANAAWITGRLARGAAMELTPDGRVNPFTVAELVCRKQHDYGHQNILSFGAKGLIVRVSDKLARYQNLVKKKHAGVVESIDDTLMDLLGYSVIAHMNLNETFLRGLTEDYQQLEVAS